MKVKCSIAFVIGAFIGAGLAGKMYETSLWKDVP